jgi:hypothetical protein
MAAGAVRFLEQIGARRRHPFAAGAGAAAGRTQQRAGNVLVML